MHPAALEGRELARRRQVGGVALGRAALGPGHDGVDLAPDAGSGHPSSDASRDARTRAASRARRPASRSTSPTAAPRRSCAAASARSGRGGGSPRSARGGWVPRRACRWRRSSPCRSRSRESRRRGGRAQVVLAARAIAAAGMSLVRESHVRSFLVCNGAREHFTPLQGSVCARQSGRTLRLRNITWSPWSWSARCPVFSRP